MSAPGPNGFLLVDKPGGWTSHDVVAKVRNAIGVKKVGHAGTLDPMATGLLVLGIGRATRLLRFVQDAPKRYVATVQFGVATDTLDADGAVITREPMSFDEVELSRALERFRGPIMQVPPMVSARKVEGRRLYELAREGVEVPREARAVTIHGLDVVEFAPSDYPVAVVDVTCTSGTYIRTLADDLARALGGRAHLTALRRVANGRLRVDDAHSIDAVVAAASDGSWTRLVLPPAAGLPDLPAATVAADVETRVRNGVPIPAEALGRDLADGPVRILDGAGRLLAVYAVGDGKATAEVVIP